MQSKTDAQLLVEKEVSSVGSDKALQTLERTSATMKSTEGHPSL